MTHITLRGKILYTSKKAERMDKERGREFFSLTEQADGTSVLHAHCEIDDAPDVIRDVTCAFDTATMRPLDASVRISVGSRFEGSGWFQFGENSSTCEMINHQDGRISQKLDHDGPISWFGHHAIINDGFLSRYFPMNAKPGKRAMTNVMMSSPDHRGATGPLLFPMKFSVVYEKDETITVGAGTFNARKFLITDTAGNLPEEHPPYEIWVTRDKRGLFLQGGVGGYMMTWYELVELQT